MAKISLRIDFGTETDMRIGPGKISLLEAVVAHKSISAAARELGMSYRRAWLLLDAMNRLFHSPVIATATGGQQGGGAELTKTGEQVLETFRAIENAAAQAGRSGLKTLSALVASTPPAPNRAGSTRKVKAGKARPAG